MQLLFNVICIKVMELALVRFLAENNGCKAVYMVQYFVVVADVVVVVWCLSVGGGVKSIHN